MEFQFNDILSVLANVNTEVPAIKLSTRMHLGDHKSTFFGPSYDIFDVQEYDPERDPPNQIIPLLMSEEDDIIFARKCIEQHEVRVVFLVDLSSSLDIGLGFLKRRLLLESIGFIGAAGARHQDPVGLVGFTDKIVLNMPTRCGLSNFHYLLRCTYDFFENQRIDKPRATDFYEGFDHLRKVFDKPCFVPIISDFIGFQKIIHSPLFKFISSRHELVFIFLDDPAEFSRNAGWGYVRLDDIESGRSMIVSRRKLRKLDSLARIERKALRNELRRMRIDSIVLEYGRHIKRLQRFFIRRHKMIRS